MTAKILTVDIETQRAIGEFWDCFPKYIDRVKVPTRILCFAAKWHDEEEVQFYSAWKERKDYTVDPKEYRKMLQAAWDLLNEADVVVTYNGDRFDLQWFRGEFTSVGMGPPSPFRSLDLFKIVKSKFGASLMRLKLDTVSKKWLDDKKVPHRHTDLWDDIRYGDKQAKAEAQQCMMDYNIHDVVLTEKLLDRCLPWTGINFALYDEDNAEREVCPFCESPKIQKRGKSPALTYMYQRYYCKACKGWFKGKKMIYSTSLRPV